MDFLLECIGFPPNQPLEEIVRLVRERGEPAAWRGDPERHLRLALGGGLEVRVDQEHADSPWSVLPYYQESRRLRVRVETIRTLPDSPFDALLLGWAAPPVFEGEEPSFIGRPLTSNDNGPSMPRERRGAYRLSMYLTDARRLPPKLPRDHVLAVHVAAFALDVNYCGPDEGAFEADVVERASGASIVPLGSPEDPGGCAEVSLRVRKVLHLENPLTKVMVDVLEVEAPERPLHLFVSRWQLEQDGLPHPRPGWRIEGTFLFLGRIAGGLPTRAASERNGFG